MYRARVGVGGVGGCGLRIVCEIIWCVQGSPLTSALSPPSSRQVEDVELKPGGADIDVTESNKKEYVG